MIQDLKSGKAVGLSLVWRSEYGSFDSTHAVTLFGVITNNEYSQNDIRYYDSLIIADSDNSTEDYDTTYGINDRNRRDVSNTLTVVGLEQCEGRYGGTRYVKCKEYGAEVIAYTALTPYSKSITSMRETDTAATKNRNTDIDFFPTDIRVSAVENAPDEGTVNTKDFCVSYTFTDMGTKKESYDKNVHAVGNIKIVCKLLNSEGKTIKTYRHYYAVDTKKTRINNGSFRMSGIAAGKYKALITLNSDKDITEAYFCNNKMTKEFEITDSGYDFSGISMKADVEKIAIDSETAEVAVKHSGWNSCKDVSNCRSVTAYTSYCKDDRWGEWQSCNCTYTEVAGAGYLPDKIKVAKLGSKVRFALSLATDKGNYWVLSPEYELSYFNCEVIPTEENTAETSAMPKKSTKLNNSEKISFVIKNTSVGKEEELYGDYIIYTNYDSKFVNLKDSVKFDLKPGEQTEKIELTSWGNNFAPENSAYIRVGVNFSQNGSTGINITHLNIQEDKSTVPDIPWDTVDPCDGQISLREAVAYAAETGKTVTASPEKATRFELAEPITINGKVKLDLGGGSITPDTSYDIVKYTNLFNIQKGADVEISNAELSYCHPETEGGAIVIEGGSLKLNNCNIKYCNSPTKGGAIYANGGKLVIKNSSIQYCTAPLGTAVFIDGGAKAEILNTFIGCVCETKGVIYNRSGSLNVINSTIIPLYEDNYENYPDGKKYNRAIIANKNTNVVNSIVYARADSSVSGDVNLYYSVTNKADAEVSIGTGTTLCPMSDICYVNNNGTPRVLRSGIDFITLYLKDTAKNGAKTSVKNGKLVLTDAKSKVTSTNISTSFTNTELSVDADGKNRTAVFGNVVQITPYGTPLTEDNLMIFGPTAKTYTGKAITPKITASYFGQDLKEGVDYTVSYKNNINAGTATVTVTGIGEYRESVSVAFEIKKAANTMTATTVQKTVLISKLAKANQKVTKAITVSKNKGTVSYKKVSGSKYMSISSTGVITIKKGKFKTGTIFKMNVKVTAKGTANYKSASKTLTVRVKAK